MPISQFVDCHCKTTSNTNYFQIFIIYAMLRIPRRHVTPMSAKNLDKEMAGTIEKLEGKILEEVSLEWK